MEEGRESGRPEGQHRLQGKAAEVSEATRTDRCADWCWGAHLGWALGCLDKVGGLAQPSVRASLSAPWGQMLA